jgi:hypothetical protein
MSAERRPFPAVSAMEVRLIIASGNRGKGVEGDPVRAVYTLFTHDGQVICTFDPYADPEGYVSGALQRLMYRQIASAHTDGQADG